jgi:predicted subunit of tRNA(5-methylaminomethyl-2-thiouridylate) methyltransferase
MLDNAIKVLESRIRELKGAPYRDVQEYVESLEIAVAVLKQNSKEKADYERDLDAMYVEYLKGA